MVGLPIVFMFNLHKDIIFIPEFRHILVCGYNPHNIRQEIVNVINEIRKIVGPCE